MPSKILAPLATCAALLLAPAAALAQNVVNIVGAPGAEEFPYAEARGWAVVGATIRNRFAYCAAEVPGGAAIRIGFDGGQWQIGVEQPSRKGDFEGSMEIDGQVVPITGVSDGRWTFVWLTLGDLDTVKNGKRLVLDIGRASLDYDLQGTAAAILKIDECVRGKGQPPAPAASAPAAPAAPAGLRFDYASAGPWTIEYYKRNPKSPKAQFCAMTRIVASEVVVRFRLDGKSLDIDLMGDSTGALGPRVPVTYVFSSKSNKGVPAKATAQVTTDPEGTEWLSILEKGLPVGHAEAMADADTLTVRSQTKTWRYPLGDTVAPFDAVMECVQKHVM